MQKLFDNPKVMDALLWFGVFVIVSFLAVTLAFVRGAFAQEKDRSQWANSPNKQWYDTREMNDAARKRLGVSYKSCCDAGDHYRTKFKVAEDNSDQWLYLRDGVWRIVPPDIIKEDETPENQPVLFINKHTGVELCFFLPKGGT